MASSLQEADKKLGESAQEISKLSKQLAHCQARSSSMKKELEALQHNYDQEKISHQSTKESLDSLRINNRDDIEEHCRFLSLLHEQVMFTAKSVSQSGSSDSEVELGQSWPSTSTPIMQAVPMDWANLSKAVSIAVLDLCDTFKQSKKDTKILKSTAVKLKSTLESTLAMHKGTTCKLKLEHEEQETLWTQRNEQMKAHFEALLVETENRALNLQKRLDSTLQDFASLTQSKQQLEVQLKQLRETHRVYKNDRACLLSCTCLLAGSLMPVLVRLQQLSLQKAILLKQLMQSERLHCSAIEVVSSIQDHIGAHVASQAKHSTQTNILDSTRNQPRAMLPLLKFRKVVIAVLAANRLQTICMENNTLFKANFSRSACLFQVPVHLGYRDKKTSNDSPNTRYTYTSAPQSGHSNNLTQNLSSKEIAGWLRSEKVLVEVRESFTPLQSMLDSCTSQQQWQKKGQTLRRDKSSRTSHHSTVVLRPAKSAFETLLEKMDGHFPHVKSLSNSSIICSDSPFYLRLQPKSLCYHLAQGLSAILKDKSCQLQSYIKSDDVSNNDS